VTASADQGARQTIRRIARENPAARIVATGCYATRCAAEVAALPGVSAVVPNDGKDARTMVATLLDRSGRPVDTALGPCGRLAPGLMGRTAWTLRVQTGCEESCSYCIIPTTRGASRSRPVGDILEEVARVVAAGYKELIVTGVHLGSYGRDLRPRRSLIDLLRSIVEVNTMRPLDRQPADRLLVRISSLEPMDCPSDMVTLVASRPAVDGSVGVACAPHFHLPLQHASNPVLRRMRRPYSIEQYAALVDEIRQRLPHAAIGSDLIVGFPGETDEDFAALEGYLEQSPLTHLHVFPYSDRPGTEAASLSGKVHGATVKARAERLREISRRLHARFRDAQRRTRRPALTIDDGTVAVTDNYIRVPVGPGHARNEWVMVTI
jgi:threonylcarbamoyladenosine tRNA methylthiotransferase MtaB